MEEWPTELRKQTSPPKAWKMRILQFYGEYDDERTPGDLLCSSTTSYGLRRRMAYATEEPAVELRSAFGKRMPRSEKVQSIAIGLLQDLAARLIS
jgi:hypothetical protein